jgi:hypothetical protein
VSSLALFVYHTFLILASRLFHNRINIKRLYSLNSSSLFCEERAPGCRLLLLDDAEEPRTYLHIYYSDGSWGPPHANGQTYALVWHLFAYTTASCTLEELKFPSPPHGVCVLTVSLFFFLLLYFFVCIHLFFPPVFCWLLL